MQRSALCRSRRELSHKYLLAKFGFDTAENEPCKVCPLSAYRSPRFDYLTGDNQPTDPAMKARFKDNLKKEPLVNSVIALVKAEAIKLGNNLETGLKKCMLCGYSMGGVMITYIVSEHELRVLGVLAIHCQILDCTDAKRLANNVDHLVLINRSGDGIFLCLF